MCGIAGELTADRLPDLAVVERTSAALAARGPDGSGTWSSERCALAHRRLSIIDLSRCASQPMVDPQLGLVIAFNEVMLVDDPVKRVDNMTMAWGIEARTPFLDHELVELAATCPPDVKLADGGKGVLEVAARGLVPDAVIDREKGYFRSRR